MEKRSLVMEIRSLVMGKARLIKTHRFLSKATENNNEILMLKGRTLNLSSITEIKT